MSSRYTKSCSRLDNSCCREANDDTCNSSFECLPTKCTKQKKEHSIVRKLPRTTYFILLTFKPVFHFKRTVLKRIKNIFKFQNLVNVDWLILPQYAKRLIGDELFILIREYTRKYTYLSTSFQSTHAHRYGTVRYGKLAALLSFTAHSGKVRCTL